MACAALWAARAPSISRDDSALSRGTKSGPERAGRCQPLVDAADLVGGHGGLPRRVARGLCGPDSLIPAGESVKVSSPRLGAN